jgi:hypothetical protein
MTDEPQPKARETSKIRSIFAAVFGIIAIVGLFASTIAVWAQGVLFDSDKVAAAAESAIQQPEAAESMATYVTDQVFTIVDLEALLEQQLPGNLDSLSGVIVGGARQFVEGQLADVLQKPAVQQVLVTIVRTAHAQLMKVLSGDGMIDGVSIADGKVTLNLLPLVTLGLNQVQKLGVLTGVTVPTLKADGDPTTQIAELESAFGRDLPADFGQLTVFKGDAAAEAGEMVQTAQDIVVLVKRAIALILIVTAVAFVLTLLVANRHRRAILVLGLAGAAVMLVARVAINMALARTPNLIIDPGARSALASALQDLAGGLVELVTLLIIIGLAAAAVVLLTGTGAAAVRFRSASGGSILTANREISATVAFGLAVLAVSVFGLDLVPLIVAAGLSAVGAALLLSRKSGVSAA